MFGFSTPEKVSSIPLTHSPPVQFNPLLLAWTALSPSLLILVAYLAGIVALTAWILLRSVYAKRVENRNAKWEQRVWAGMAVTSVIATWYHMVRFFSWSYTSFVTDRQLGALPLPAYPHCAAALPSAACTLTSTTVALQRITLWLRSTTLFWQAWERVISNEANWWYSAEICAITVGAWMLFLRREGTRIAIPHVWAYMVLGQLVAISVAMNLFFLALSLRPDTDGTLLHQTVLTSANARDGDDEDDHDDGTQAPAPSPTTVKTIENGIVKTTVTVTRSTRFPFEAVGARILVWWCVLQGLVAVWSVPSRTRSLVNVLAMHAYPLAALLLLVVEASGRARRRLGLFTDTHLSLIPSEWLSLLRADGPATRHTLRYSTLHLLVALTSLALKARTTVNLWGVISRAAPPFQRPDLRTLARTLYPVTFHSHPAQASISADALLVALSVALWAALDAASRSRTASARSAGHAGPPHAAVALASAALTPLLGPAATFALFCASRERLLEHVLEADEMRVLARAGVQETAARHAERSYVRMNTTHVVEESVQPARARKTQ